MGILITFEGTEGSGKSTLIQGVARSLGDAGHPVVVTREPGGHPVSEKIREILLSQDMDRWTELFLYEAARSEHMAKLVLPELERGALVLCDRFTDSSLAYQAHARGLPWAAVTALNKMATRGRKPDLTVFLDLDPAIGLRRAQPTRFEAEGLEFHKKVRAGFARARRTDPRRWFVLPVHDKNPGQVLEAVLAEIHRRLGRKLRNGDHPEKKERGKRK